MIDLYYCRLPPLTPIGHAEFEGDEYYKTEVKPTLADGSTVDASVYVWQDSARYANFITIVYW